MTGKEIHAAMQMRCGRWRRDVDPSERLAGWNGARPMEEPF